MLELGLWLDSMIPRGFSNQNVLKNTSDHQRCTKRQETRAPVHPPSLDQRPNSSPAISTFLSRYQEPSKCNFTNVLFLVAGSEKLLLKVSQDGDSGAQPPPNPSRSSIITLRLHLWLIEAKTCPLSSPETDEVQSQNSPSSFKEATTLNLIHSNTWVKILKSSSFVHQATGTKTKRTTKRKPNAF